MPSQRDFLLDALGTLNIDIIVECTKVLAKYDPETERHGSPSLEANIGTQLKKVIDVAHNILHKRHRSETERMDKLKVLKELITSEWQYEV